MRNVLFFSCCLVLGLLLPACCVAQTSDPSFERLDQLMRRMQEQMRQGMNFDSTFENGRLQYSPDSSSFFYFHVDTSFNGSGADFFNFAPFGSPDQSGFSDFDQLIEQFFNRSTPFSQRVQPGQSPADDGQLPETDGLLPEERLRLEEEKGQPGKQPEQTAKSKVKTIRI